MTVWRWADGHYLWALVGVVLLVGWIGYVQRSQIRRLTLALGSSVLPVLMRGFSRRIQVLQWGLVSFALTCLVLAWARPQFGESKESVKSMGVEMMILFDVSQSMLAEDVSPSRLEFAKKEVLRLVDQLPGSKVGLVAFAGSAALVSPITTDGSALKMFVESLTTETIATQGTEFKMALEQAEAAYARGGQVEDPSERVTRVILIVSDGEDQEPGALEAAETLAKKGIRIFSVAIGTEKGGPIPLRDPNGFLRGYKKDAKGQVITTTSRGDVLKSLAKAGQGSFYTASFGGSYLDELVEDINQLEKTEFDTQTLVNYRERFQLFVLLGVIALMLDLFLGRRRLVQGVWRGRFQAEDQ